jgi:hypothetical protein
MHFFVLVFFVFGVRMLVEACNEILEVFLVASHRVGVLLQLSCVFSFPNLFRQSGRKPHQHGVKV